MQPNQTSKLSIGVLITLQIPDGPTFRIQNYCPGIYTYCGVDFNFAPFEAIGLTRRLDMTADPLEATFSPANVNDTLGAIRDLVKDYDGWRKANVTITTFEPDNLERPPYTYRGVVLNSNIGESLNITIRHPLEAINARVPYKLFDRMTVPGLPMAGSGTV